MLTVNTPLRYFQATLAITTLALNGHVTKWYLDHTRTKVAPSATIFLLSLGVLTLAALPYLLFNPSIGLSSTNGARGNGRRCNKYLVLGVDLILMCLWFAGFVGLAVFQHGLHLCGGHVCELMIGSSVVGAIMWATFTATFSLAVLHVLRTRTGSEAKAEKEEPASEPTPSPSQRQSVSTIGEKAEA